MLRPARQAGQLAVVWLSDELKPLPWAGAKQMGAAVGVLSDFGLE